MESPKISIITITYNSEKTVRDTFDSIRRQKYENLEYIVVDGGSRDSTLLIAEEYNDIISVLKSEPDRGISDAMNKGINLASGDLIGIIHSDDMLIEGTLDTLSKVWDGETDVYYGDAIICDETGKKMNILTSSADLSPMPYTFCIVHPATFVTKKAYQKYGAFDVKLKCAMDYDLILRMFHEGAKFKYIDQPLSLYRMGGTNMRLRRQTVDEVRDISVRYGGSRVKANALRWKKIVADRLRPLINILGLKNKRVKDL